MRNFLLSLSLVLVLPDAAFAKPPAPPDISGTWALNVSKSKLVEGNAIRSETVSISCSGSKIVMRDNVDGKQSAMTYYADGKEHPFAEVEGGEDLMKAHWKKSVLLIETIARVKTQNSALDGTELWHLQDEWSVSADGRVLTEKSEGFDTAETRVYERQ
jgi:hypothetical protein